MGTPDFARTILERLVADGHDVCGVFTQPDKPRNRNKVTPSPVKEYALSQNIPVFQPVTMRDGTALEDFKTLAPELAIVAAYGRILPEEMLAVPVHGCINAHASILPKYRGAAPINRAILDGEKETGVTVMHMAKECDAGDMILVKKQAIRPDETAEDLFKELAVLGADAIAEAIVEIQNGTAQRVPQDESQATYAPMLSRELSPIDWTRSSTQIIDQIRALIPWPCAAASILGANTKIFHAVPLGETKDVPGTLCARKKGIEAACGVRPGIKWPNDLVLNRKKLCGILTELEWEAESGEFSCVIIGAGINVSQDEADFGPEVAPIAISLAQALGMAPDRTELAARVIRSLNALYDDFPSQNAAYLDHFRRDCLTVGNPIKVISGAGERIGTATGISDDFGLTVRWEDGSTETLTSGEVSVRGLYDYV